MRVVTIGVSNVRQKKCILRPKQNQTRRSEPIRTHSIAEAAIKMVNEMNDPLTIVKGYLQFFQKSAADKKQDWLLTVFQELTRMETLIDTFVAVSRKCIAKKSQHL